MAKHEIVEVGDLVMVTRVKLRWTNPDNMSVSKFKVPGLVYYTSRDGLGIKLADGSRDQFAWWDKRWKRA